MTDHRGWQLPESHLLPDAIVAFVDGELSPSAQDRASAHIAGCAGCAEDVRAQRQAMLAVRGAQGPSVSSGLLANLRAIPDTVDLPSSPDGLALSEDGQLVCVQRSDGANPGAPDAAGPESRPLGTNPLGSTPVGSSSPLGTSPPLGTAAPLAGDGRGPKRATQGAGVVVSGLVLGALAMVSFPLGDGDSGDDPMAGLRPAITGGIGVLQAGFGLSDSSPSSENTQRRQHAPERQSPRQDAGARQGGDAERNTAPARQQGETASGVGSSTRYPGTGHPAPVVGAGVR